MIQIRQGVFETNSSSTHSITMASGDMFDKWKSGEVYLNESWISVDNNLDNKTWLTNDEVGRFVAAYAREYDVDMPDIEDYDEFLQEEFCIYTYDGFFNDGDYETYEDDYFTEGGERVVAFGYYGWS